MNLDCKAEPSEGCFVNLDCKTEPSKGWSVNVDCKPNHPMVQIGRELTPRTGKAPRRESLAWGKPCEKQGASRAPRQSYQKTP